MYFASHSVGGAIGQAEKFMDRLHRDWGLLPKPGSCVVMPLSAAPESAALQEIAARHPGWRFSESFPVLGMNLSHDGSVVEDLEDACRQVWRISLMNCGGKAAAKLSFKSRLRLLRRVAESRLDFRGTRWPPTPSVAKALDATQH